MIRTNSKYIVLACLLALACVRQGIAQDGRTNETKVADVLALFPAKTASDADRLFADLIALDDAGLDLLMSGVLPNGKEEGVAARYAVSLLTHHAGSKDQKARIERAYLRALDASKDAEVKSYFVENLKIVGTNASVDALAKRIAEERVGDQAIAALVTIGSDAALAALNNALQQKNPVNVTARLIHALAERKHKPSASAIAQFAGSEDASIRRQALWALALLADGSSFEVLLREAKKAGFRHDAAEAVEALVQYIYEVSAEGNDALAVRASQELLSNTLAAEQQHIRLAALKVLSRTQPTESVKTLIKELNRFDAGYGKEVLKIAAQNLENETVARQWMKVYKKGSTLQAEILGMLATAKRNDSFVEETLLPALRSKNEAVRIAAADAIAYSSNKKFQPALVSYLLGARNEAEIAAGKDALLRMMDGSDADVLIGHLASAPSGNRIAVIDILAGRHVHPAFDAVSDLTSSQDGAVRKAAFDALPGIASPDKVGNLLTLLGKTQTESETKAVQAAVIASMDESSRPLVNAAYDKNRAKILPLLPFVNDENALAKVSAAFTSGSPEEKAAAFEALLNWQDHSAARTLLSIRRDPDQKQYHQKAFQAFVAQVSNSSWPDDQKLLMLDAGMKEATTTAEKTSIIRAVGTLRTFLALTFVSRYLDDSDLNRAASRSAMQIALPTADARPGLAGTFVRNTLQKILDKLEGQDSQYEVIDIQTYLANMPYTRGFEPIFNGKDLSGWQGLVENPIARSKMTKAELARKQKEADEKIKESWSVRDGAIYFTGHGDNLCTTRPYGDFEMLVDWKISRDGDSGIYLRGSPQVQIWDPWGKSENTRVGSGGLFNNKTHPSKPLAVADNPIGEWNTFHIKMISDRVTVHLNGVLVVDNVVMENYWDRNIPIFSQEAIELQAHGNELAFRNIFVRELSPKSTDLSPTEKQEGFELLFNGKDLNNWVGNKTEYVVEDNTIAIYPVGKGHGNLYTEKQYGDFVFRFEFQLTPGANNGLGIHATTKGDAAYGGKEIQILDDTAPVYANLQPYQYHGSVYGMVPARRGYLKPVGEWNEEEVYVKGDRIRVTLNGTVIVDTDLKQATKNGTLDGKEHPGLHQRMGHIGFLGHGTVVRFRNIRVKDLGNTRQ